MFISQINDSGCVRLKEFNKMKKFALYSILSALMLSALVLGCGHGNNDGGTPGNDSPIVGVWEIKNMDGVAYPGDAKKDLFNINSEFVPNSQPYFYLAGDNKAHYAIKDTNGNLTVKKPAYDYKIADNKITIGSVEFIFVITGNNVLLTGTGGKPVINATKVEKPIGADIVAAPAIQ